MALHNQLSRCFSSCDARIEKKKVPIKKWWLPSFVAERLKKTSELIWDDTDGTEEPTGERDEEDDI